MAATPDELAAQECVDAVRTTIDSAAELVRIAGAHASLDLNSLLDGIYCFHAQLETMVTVLHAYDLEIPREAVDKVDAGSNPLKLHLAEDGGGTFVSFTDVMRENAQLGARTAMLDNYRTALSRELGLALPPACRTLADEERGVAQRAHPAEGGGSARAPLTLGAVGRAIAVGVVAQLHHAAAGLASGAPEASMLRRDARAATAVQPLAHARALLCRLLALAEFAPRHAAARALHAPRGAAEALRGARNGHATALSALGRLAHLASAALEPPYDAAAPLDVRTALSVLGGGSYSELPLGLGTEWPPDAAAAAAKAKAASARAEAGPGGAPHDARFLRAARVHALRLRAPAGAAVRACGGLVVCEVPGLYSLVLFPTCALPSAKWRVRHFELRLRVSVLELGSYAREQAALGSQLAAAIELGSRRAAAAAASEAGAAGALASQRAAGAGAAAIGGDAGGAAAGGGVADAEPRPRTAATPPFEPLLLGDQLASAFCARHAVEALRAQAARLKLTTAWRARLGLHEPPPLTRGAAGSAGLAPRGGGAGSADGSALGSTAGVTLSYWPGRAPAPGKRYCASVHALSAAALDDAAAARAACAGASARGLACAGAALAPAPLSSAHAAQFLVATLSPAVEPEAEADVWPTLAPASADGLGGRQRARVSGGGAEPPSARAALQLSMAAVDAEQLLSSAVRAHTRLLLSRLCRALCAAGAAARCSLVTVDGDGGGGDGGVDVGAAAASAQPPRQLPAAPAAAEAGEPGAEDGAQPTPAARCVRVCLLGGGCALCALSPVDGAWSVRLSAAAGSGCPASTAEGAAAEPAEPLLAALAAAGDLSTPAARAAVVAEWAAFERRLALGQLSARAAHLGLRPVGAAAPPLERLQAWQRLQRASEAAAISSAGLGATADTAAEQRAAPHTVGAPYSAFAHAPAELRHAISLALERAPVAAGSGGARAPTETLALQLPAHDGGGAARPARALLAITLVPAPRGAAHRAVPPGAPSQGGGGAELASAAEVLGHAVHRLCCRAGAGRGAASAELVLLPDAPPLAAAAEDGGGVPRGGRAAGFKRARGEPAPGVELDAAGREMAVDMEGGVDGTPWLEVEAERLGRSVQLAFEALAAQQ